AKTEIHMLLSVFLFVGAVMAAATFRPHSMKSLAKELSVRFLTVMIAVATRGAGKFIARILSPAREALNRATELGKSPTNWPLPIRGAARGPDNERRLAGGGCPLLARKISRISDPGTLSWGGRTHGASARSPKSTCRRPALWLRIPQTATNGSSNKVSTIRS